MSRLTVLVFVVGMGSLVGATEAKFSATVPVSEVATLSGECEHRRLGSLGMIADCA